MEGIGSFLGPIIGAISLTYLDTVLSDITEAWVLYFGAIFIIVVSFAPNGIAGIIEMHGPVFRVKPKLLRKLLFPYLFLLLSMAVLCLGFTCLIELLHALNYENKKVIKLYWLNFNKNSIALWLLSSTFLIIGMIITFKQFKKTKIIWEEVINEIKLSLRK